MSNPVTLENVDLNNIDEINRLVAEELKKKGVDEAFVAEQLRRAKDPSQTPSPVETTAEVKTETTTQTRNEAPPACSPLTSCSAHRLESP